MLKGKILGRYEVRELQVEFLTHTKIQHVHPADFLSSQSLVHIHQVIRYLVPTTLNGST